MSHKLTKLLAISIFLLLCSCNSTTRETVKVGFIGTLSGPYSALGSAGRDGALLAIDELNRSGGLNGREVELIITDDANQQETAAAAMLHLVESNVVGVIGPMTSEMAHPVIEIANRSQTVVLSPTIATETLSGRDDFFLRIYPSVSEASAKMALYAHDFSQLETFAIAYDDTNATFTSSWIENFKRDFENLGGKVLVEIPFPGVSGQTSYSQIAAQVMKSGAEGTLVLANPYATAMFYQNLKKLNSETETFAAEWSLGPDLFRFGGRDIDQLKLFRTYFKDDNALPTRQFSETFSGQYKTDALYSSVHTYDAARYMLRALQSNQNHAQLKEALLRLGSFQGVQNTFELDRNGDVLRPHYITRLAHGQESLVATLNAPSWLSKL